LSAASLKLFAEARLRGDLSAYLEPMRRMIAEYRYVEIRPLRRLVRQVAKVVEPVTPAWVIRATTRWRLRG
jgi:hypothetical protein